MAGEGGGALRGAEPPGLKYNEGDGVNDGEAGGALPHGDGPPGGFPSRDTIGSTTRGRFLDLAGLNP